VNYTTRNGIRQFFSPEPNRSFSNCPCRANALLPSSSSPLLRTEAARGAHKHVPPLGRGRSTPLSRPRPIDRGTALLGRRPNGRGLGDEVVFGGPSALPFPCPVCFADRPRIARDVDMGRPGSIEKLSPAAAAIIVDALNNCLFGLGPGPRIRAPGHTSRSATARAVFHLCCTTARNSQHEPGSRSPKTDLRPGRGRSSGRRTMPPNVHSRGAPAQRAAAINQAARSRVPCDPRTGTCPKGELVKSPVTGGIAVAPPSGLPVQR